MKKTYLLLLCFLCTTAIAQRNLTMEDVVLNIRTSLAPKKVAALTWIKGEDAYSFVDSTQTLRRQDVVKKDAKKSLPLAVLNARLKSLKADTLLKFPEHAWENKNAFTFTSSKKLLQYDFEKDSLRILAERNYTASTERHDEEKNTRAVAYTVGNNLYILHQGNIITVTNDAEKNIVNGQSVHRDEFGITKGTFWSPKGNYLAFYRMDQTMVTDYPLVDITKKPAAVEMIKYPMAGERSHEVTVGIYDMKSAKTVFLQTGTPADQYLTNVAWSPDEKHVFIAVVNRDQNEMKFNSYNAQTGAFENTLFTETDPKYVHPQKPMVFVPGHPHEFIWQSRRNGYNHLFLYETTGRYVGQLTSGNWEVTSFDGFDEKGTRAYFTSTVAGHLNRDFCSVEILTGKIFRFTSGEGTHTCSVSTSGNYVIDKYSSTSNPLTTSIINWKGKVVSVLLDSPNPLKDFALGKVSLFTIKGANGIELQCRQYFPVNFDSTKKYPLIIYLYGGPNVQLLKNSWYTSGDLWMQYMAERGYVVFTLENRGTANRGSEFEQATFRNLGKIELEDQQLGINYLETRPYIDQKRMGIYGWSYGGFLTTSMMTRYPGIFKVGVAGGPVIDWRYYEVMFTERYMDTPQTNKDGYDYSNVLKFAEELKGKLLVIHGTMDTTVVWQQSLLFIDKCISKGVPVDYFVYPGSEHNMVGHDRVHLLNKIASYFEDNL